MLQTLVKLSLEFRHLVLAAAVLLVAAGAVLLPKAKIDALPEFGAPIVEVQTEALGLSTGEVESLVTINLEEILTATPFLKSIHSRSVPGMASVLLTFEPGMDPMKARQMVQERLTMAWALPNVSKPPTMLQPKSAAGRGMIVGLSSKTVSLIDMSVLARWTMTPKLLSVPGVANVAIWGQRARQLQVQIEPQRLESAGISLDEAIESAGDSLWVSPLSYLEASVLGSGGWIDTPNQRLGIQHVQPISKASDLTKVAVPSSALRLGDVAEVVEGHPPLIGDAMINGQPGLILVVEKLPNVDTKAVVAGVEAALAELSQGMPGIDIDASLYRASDYVDSALANLAWMVIAAMVVVSVALFLSLTPVGAASIAVVAIVLSYVAALVALYFSSPIFNLIHLAGLAAALSLVVDTAVVAAEAIGRRLHAGGGRPVAAPVFDAIGEIGKPMIYAAVIGLLAVAPILGLDGETAAFFRPLAQAYGLTVAAAMVVVLLAAPALAMIFFRSGRAAGNRSEPRLFGAAYGRLLGKFSATTGPAYAIAGLGALALLAATPALKWSPSPSFDEGTVRVSFTAAPGASLPAMIRTVARLESEIRAIDGVSSVAGHLGRAITGDQVTGIESGQLWIGLDERGNRAAALSQIRDTMEGFADLEVKVEGYLASTAGRIFADAGEPVVVRIEGAETTVLEEQAKLVAARIAAIDGINSVRLDKNAFSPEIEVKVDVAEAAARGLKPGDIRRAAATVFAGLEVGNLFEQQKVFEVVVWGAPNARSSIADVENLLIETPDRPHTRLGDIAEVRMVPQLSTIERDGVTRSMDVHASVAGRSVTAVAEDVAAELKKVQLPFEYHAYVRGEYAESRAAMLQVTLFAVSAAVLIFFLLQAALQSWRLATGMFLSLVAVSGGVAAILVAVTGTVSIGTLAGLLAVLGLSLRNGLVLASRVDQTGEQTGDDSWPDLVAAAARERFAPVLTSTLITCLAFLPAVVMGSAAGLEILHPMAWVVIAGAVISVLINLFVLPAMLLHSGPVSQRLGGVAHASQ
ncbi:efflux RND transporter permease subunit [Mesorhizobium sp. WSM3860]|uniref:efflux RND transporter permease subunit n=1 Tax=Mesorhizobium sp. WSM3860 TaxID=2029403 RepID=UPI0015969291|nr:efflux RND transporter permease subunit [Mesorhizobium sp. WSM3860]